MDRKSASHLQQQPTITFEKARELYPDFSKTELEEACLFLENYTKGAWKICLRLEYDEELQKRFGQLKIEYEELLKAKA